MFVFFFSVRKGWMSCSFLKCASRDYLRFACLRRSQGVFLVRLVFGFRFLGSGFCSFIGLVWFCRFRFGRLGFWGFGFGGRSVFRVWFQNKFCFILFYFILVIILFHFASVAVQWCSIHPKETLRTEANWHCPTSSCLLWKEHPKYTPTYLLCIWYA